MEKKTIGAFIAVMRKSKGLTQKDLAEKLGVSDKTVSHWERNETYPDISIIPILSDIFDITCDELIRGEKISATREDKINDEKTEKQLKNLIKRRYEKFRIQALVSAMIFLAGFALSYFLYDSFGWNWFLISLIFFVVSVFCLVIFKMQFLSSIQTNEFEIKVVNDYKKKSNRFMLLSIYVFSFFIIISLCMYWSEVYIIFQLYLAVSIIVYLLLAILGYINLSGFVDKIKSSEKTFIIFKSISVTVLVILILVSAYYLIYAFASYPISDKMFIMSDVYYPIAVMVPIIVFEFKMIKIIKKK